jgi:hypothetical protein
MRGLSVASPEEGVIAVRDWRVGERPSGRSFGPVGGIWDRAGTVGLALIFQGN